MTQKLLTGLRRKVTEFEESGMGYWIVTATLDDGRRFSNVVITDAFRLGFPDLCPFGAGDIVAVEWEGVRRGSSGRPIEVDPVDGDPA